MTDRLGKIVGVLLAGGMSRRFGSPKSFAKKNGKPFFRLSLDVLLPLADEVVIVTNDKLVDKFTKATHVPVIVDIEKYAGKGPLAGIYSAMMEEKADWYIVIPTDVPFMEKWVFKELFNYCHGNIQAVIPVVNGRLQPLIGLFHRSLQGEIKELLETETLHMRGLIDRARVAFVPFTDEGPFTNINKFEEYETLIENGLRD